MMISKYSAERVTGQYINDMNAGVKKLWDEFDELDLKNVNVRTEIKSQLTDVENEVKKAVAYIESIQFEE